MRHKGAYRKFSRTASHRKAMFRNLATSLLQEEQCETTVQKAKDLRRVVERLVRLGATDTLPARRDAYSYLMNKDVVHKLFTDIGPRFKERSGGYTRVIRTRYRAGDAAEMALIELVEKGGAPVAATKTEAPKKGAKAPKKAAAKSDAKEAAPKKKAAPKAKAKAAPAA